MSSPTPTPMLAEAQLLQQQHLKLAKQKIQEEAAAGGAAKDADAAPPANVAADDSAAAEANATDAQLLPKRSSSPRILTPPPSSGAAAAAASSPAATRNKQRQKFIQVAKSTPASQAAAAAAAASPAARVAVPQGGGLDLVALAKQHITVEMVLKPGTLKVTFKVNIGTGTYVVKAGSGYYDMVGHLINTDLFRRLNIPGIRVPLVQMLTPDFRTVLQGKLAGLNPTDSASLRNALESDGVISTLAEGFTVASILDTGKRELMKTVLTVVQSDPTTDGAVGALAMRLPKTFSSTEKRFVSGTDLANLKDRTNRAKAIAALRENVTNPAGLLILSWIGKLATQPRGEIDQQVSAGFHNIADLESAQTAFGSRVKSKEGASALGGMCVVDLIDGMDDRIVGDKFNGANFMFHPPTNNVWCVDNSKETRLVLQDGDDSMWRGLALRLFAKEGEKDAGDSIEHCLHWVIYDRKTQDTAEIAQKVVLGSDERTATQEGIKDAVAATLDNMERLVRDRSNGLADSVRAKMNTRLAFVRARQQFTQLITLADEFKTVPSVQNPWVGKKAMRIVVAAFTGRNQEQSWADGLKQQARTPGTGSGVLDQNDLDLSGYLSTYPRADQRVFKALLATRAARFALDLQQKARDLKSLAATNKAWGKLDPAVIKVVQDNVKNWVQQFTDNKDGANQLNNAMAAFINQLQ